MTQFSAHDVISEIEKMVAELLRDVNSASVAARNTWLLFMAVLTYFFITLAGVGHAHLLLDRPVTLPILQTQIPLRTFFVFAPVVLLFMHFNILLQHAVLARKANELHERLSALEGRQMHRTHNLRFQLHTYFFTQAIAGPARSRVFGGVLRAMTWVTLWLLPMVLLLYFQLAFLPYHDLAVTTAHRLYFVADFLIVAVFGIFLRFPGISFITGLARNLIRYPMSFTLMLLTWVCAMLFSFTVATIPGEGLDRAMQQIAQLRTPVPYGTPLSEAKRHAFWPTAFLFEGRIDPLSGRRSSWFSRSLVITDADLVDDNNLTDVDISLNLRGRDLRYGVFDRTDLHQADLTGSDLSYASLRDADLRRAKLAGASLVETDLSGTDLSGANLWGANARGANLSGANLNGAKIKDAILPGTAEPR